MSTSWSGRYHPGRLDQAFEMTDESALVMHGWRGDRYVGVAGRLEGLAGDDPVADLLDRYDRLGEAFADDLNGSFSLVLWDGPRRQLRLYQDPLPGINYLYVAEHDGGLVFGNSLRRLVVLAHPDGPRIDRQAIYQFLGRAYLAPPATGFEGIRQLTAGEMVTAVGGSWTRTNRPCWTIPDQKRADGEACLAEYQDRLRDRIVRHCQDPDDTVFLLSGGYDSSVNVALARDLGVAPLHTVGIGSERFSTDAGYARQVAQLCGSTHHEYLFDGSEIERLPWLVWLLESPYFEPGMMLTYHAMTIARRHGRTIIGGEGTDQLFANAQLRVRPRHAAATHAFPYRLRRRLVNGLTGLPGLRNVRKVQCLGGRLLPGLDVNQWSGRFGFRDCDLRTWVRPGWHGCDRYDDLAVPERDLNDLLDHACVPISRDYLLSGILGIYGKLSPEIDAQPISPYLDRDVVKLVLSLDYDLRTPALGGGRYDDKRLHKDLAHQLLPAELFDRPKQGGAISAWSHLEDDGYRKAVMDYLRRSEFLNEVLKPPALQRLQDDPRRHAVQMLMLLSLDLWHRYLVVEKREEPPTETLSEVLGLSPQTRPI